MSNLRYASALLLLLALLVPACGGGGGGGGGGAPPPAPFLAVEFKPAHLEPAAVRTRNLYVRLNRAALAATATDLSNVILRAGATPVARGVSYDAFFRQIVIDPTAPLAPSTTYTIELTAGVTDAAGVPLTPVTATFTTRGDADVDPPTFATPNFAATSRGVDQITLGWNAATDATGYELFVVPASGFDPMDDPDQVVAGLTHQFTGLTSDTRFEYRIRAVDAAGNLSAEFHALFTKTLTSFTQDVYNEIISARCLLCHVNGGAESPPFFMETRNQAYANLAGPTNDSFCTPNAPAKRVVPGNLASSFLNLKINPAPPCGDRMPRDGMTNPLGYLNATQIQTIQDWILEGALDN